MIAAGVALVGLISWALYRHYRERHDFDGSSSSPVASSLFSPMNDTPAFPAGRPFASPIHERSLTKPPDQLFSRELLDSLEWRRFEELVTWYFQKTGFRAERSRVGADGGVDIHLFRQNEERPFAYAQCKAWHAYTVGVKPVRELIGVLAHDRIGVGYFVTTGDFTAEAVAFSQGQPLKLVTGDYLLERLNSLPESDRVELLRDVTQGDYTTPTCPRCDIKMVLRHGPTGDFWGCPNFRLRWPQKCKQTFKLRDKEAV
jgi:restriction system protein